MHLVKEQLQRPRYEHAITNQPNNLKCLWNENFYLMFSLKTDKKLVFCRQNLISRRFTTPISHSNMINIMRQISRGRKYVHDSLWRKYLPVICCKQWQGFYITILLMVFINYRINQGWPSNWKRHFLMDCFYLNNNLIQILRFAYSPVKNSKGRISFHRHFKLFVHALPHCVSISGTRNISSLLHSIPRYMLINN